MPSNHSRDPSRRDFVRLLSAGGLALAAGRPLAADTGRRRARGAKLGVALLGLGRYSERELGPALRLTNDCELRGVITGTPEKGPRWAREYGLSERNVYSYETMSRIADNRDIDIVYVVTPPGVRRGFVERCARAGKHVLAEKPLATTVADCDAMIAACRRAGVRLSTGYRLHFDPYHREMQRIAREREFGELRRMTGERAFVLGARAWRIDKRLGGGGPLMDLGIYIIQGACMIAGTPVAVTASEGAKLKPELFNEVEETIYWTMHFPNGATCNATASFNGRSDRFRAEGDKGWLEFPDKAFTYRGTTLQTSRGPIVYPTINQQAAHMDDFARCVREQRDSVASGEMGRRDVRILLAIYEAARTGRRVSV